MRIDQILYAVYWRIGTVALALINNHLENCLSTDVRYWLPFAAEIQQVRINQTNQMQCPYPSFANAQCVRRIVIAMNIIIIRSFGTSCLQWCVPTLQPIWIRWIVKIVRINHVVDARLRHVYVWCARDIQSNWRPIEFAFCYEKLTIFNVDLFGQKITPRYRMTRVCGAVLIDVGVMHVAAHISDIRETHANELRNINSIN